MYQGYRPSQPQLMRKKMFLNRQSPWAVHHRSIEAMNSSTMMMRSFASSAKSHSASKKRFKPRAGGGMVFKPSGRMHGMHRHSRNRNRTKGAGVAISRNEQGDLWRRLRGMNLQMRNTKVLKPKKKRVSGDETIFRFSSQIQQNKSLLSIVAKEVTTDLAPTTVVIRTKLPTPKKVQWRVASVQQ